jgi:hypothetical protein
LLCRRLGGVEDWCAIDVGKGMLDKGDPEPINEGGAGGQHVVLYK